MTAVIAAALVTTSGSAEPTAGTTAKVTVGSFPYGIAINASGSTAYVVNEGNGSNSTVSVINTGSTPPAVSKSITVGKYPEGLAISPDGSTVYVPNSGSSTLSVIGTSTNTVTSTVSLNGGDPLAVAFSPSGHYAYIANYGTQNVSVIDTTTSPPTDVAEVSLGSASAPAAIAVSPDGHYIYVGNESADSNLVYVLDATNPAAPTVVAPITVGYAPVALAFKPGTQTLYVGNSSSQSISVVDTSTSPATVTATVTGIGIEAAAQPTCLAFSPDGHYLYACAVNDGTIAMLDATTSTPTLLGYKGTSQLANPQGVAITPDDGWIYATSYGNSRVTVQPNVPPPVITSMTPSSGSTAGGDTVTLTGTGFTGTTQVEFGTDSYGIDAQIQSVSSDGTQIVVTAPQEYGVSPVPVTVFTPTGSSYGSTQYAYQIGVATSSLADADVGDSYAATLTANGGTSPFAWAITSGSLPSGLALDAATGVISGTATTTGTSTFTVAVTDSSAPTAGIATASLSITVHAAPSITTTTLPEAGMGTAYSQTVSATGGASPLSWSVTSGSLPAGLTLSSSTGAITGTPSTSAVGTAFTVTATDGIGVAVSANLSIAVLGITTTSPLTPGLINTPYSTTLAAAGGTGSVTWAVSSGTLPMGLSLSSAGVISGTATAATTASVTFSATDSAVTAKRSLSLTINGALAVTTTALTAAQTGQQYSSTLAASGGLTPYTWSVISGSLPTGLTLSSTGTIAGTPSVTGTSSFTVQVADAETPTAATATKALTLTVVTPLAISTTALPNGVRSSAYSATVSATGGTAPYTWTETGTLPSGMSFNTTTGVLSGPPTATVTNRSLTFKVTDSSGLNVQKALTITIGTALSITTNSLPAGTVGTSYSATVPAAGGTTPYTWAVTAGALPAGLTLNTSTGAISGTPTSGGTASFTLKVTDSSTSHATATQAFTIVVAGPVVLAVTTSSLGVAQTGTSYSTTLAASGGTSPYTWSVASGSIPTGLSLNASTGVITGTPSTTGTSSFTVQVTDSATPTPGTATQALSIAVVAPLAITNTSLPGADRNSPYSATLAATGGTGPYTWSVVSGTLSPLTLNASTGAITGTATTAGTKSMVFKVTDSSNPALTVQASLPIVVNAALSVSTGATLTSGAIATPYSTTLAAGGGTSPFSWSISSGSLPTGLALSSAGTISGTPTAVGTSTFTVQVTDSAGTPVSKTKAVTLTIVGPPTITGISPSSGSTALGGTVVITGSGFTSATSVAFGSTPASEFTIDSDTQITATASPAAAGTVDVTVTNTAGTSQTSSADRYTYVDQYISGGVWPLLIGSSNSVTRISTSGTTANAWGYDYSITYSPDGKYAYAADVGNGLDIIADADTANPTQVARLTLSSGGYGIAFTPDGRYAYVTDGDPNTGASYVDIISGANTATPVLAQTITLPNGSNPYDIAITPDGSTAYIAYAGTGAIGVLSGVETSTPTLSGTITLPAPAEPEELAVTPDGNTLYIVDADDQIRTLTGAETSSPSLGSTFALAGGAFPISIAITPDGKYAYVGEWGGTDVRVIDAAESASPSLAATALSLDGAIPISLAITPDGNTLYAGERDVGVVALITGADTDNPTVSPTALTGGPAGSGLIALAPDTAPVASFTVTPAPAGQATSFDASGSTVEYGTIASYAWDFGDGDTATTTTATTTHTYAAGGSFSATVTETDSAGTSTTQVFTGHSTLRNGGSSAVATNQVLVTTATMFSITIEGGSGPASLAHGGQATLAATGLPVDATGVITFSSGSTTLCTATLPETSCQTSTDLAAGSYPHVSAHFTDLDGSYADSDATNTFDLDVLPVVSSINPTTGPAAGGTSVTIAGSGFTGATAVSFGSTASSLFAVTSDTSITATAPAGTGTVDVTVTGAGGTSSSSTADHYGYTGVPAVSDVSPSSGPAAGGTSVTITGSGFTGTTAVAFGSTPATLFTATSDSTITATAPAGSGTVDVTVTTPAGTSATSSNDQYVYADPTPPPTPGPSVTGLSPATGPTAGGTVLTITGTNLTGATAIAFGGVAATSFTVASATSITATAPAGSGTVDVTVTTPAGTSATSSNDQYIYADPVTTTTTEAAPPPPPPDLNPTTTTTPATTTTTTVAPAVNNAPITAGGHASVAVGSGASAVTVDVPTGAVTVAATVTATLVSTPSPNAAVTFAAGTAAVQVTVSSSGGNITQFAAPLDLQFPGAPDGIVPAYSPDGVTWTAIPQITAPPTLPEAWPDGWYRSADGVLHLLTRHATYFGLLDKSSTVNQALALTYGIRRHLNLNYRRRLVLYIDPTMPADCVIVLRHGSKVIATWHETLTANAAALRLELPRGARHIGDDTLQFTVAASGMTSKQDLDLNFVARWNDPTLNR